MHVWHVCYIPHFHPYNTDQAGLTELCWANHTSFNCYAWVCTFLNNIHSFIGECTTCSPVTFSYKKLYVYTTLPVCACVLSLQNSFCCMVVLCVLLYILWACSIKNIWVLHIDEFVILFNTLHCSVIHWKRFFTQKALQEVAIDLMQFHQFFVSSFPPFLSQSFPFFRRIPFLPYRRMPSTLLYVLDQAELNDERLRHHSLLLTCCFTDVQVLWALEL